MLIALVLLNILYLLCSLLFNAELLNMAGADIPLKSLQTLEIYGQILAASSLCLLAWRICVRHFQGRRLAGALALSTAIIAPATFWVQGEAPEWIAERLPAELRVNSLYAYVTKKGLLNGALTIQDLPYEEYREAGEGKAFIANLGVLMSAEGEYVQMIDGNFQAFATLVFRRFAQNNADAIHARLQEEVVPEFEAILARYRELEARRLARLAPAVRQPLDAQAHPGAEDYARAIAPGLRSREAVARSPEVRQMARSRLGPLYVEGMNILATRQQFNAYLPKIAANMAYDVAHTDIHGEQGLKVLKNMLFVPFSLFSALLFGSISLLVLVVSLFEMVVGNHGQLRRLKVIAALGVLLAPLLIGNAISDSAGYRKLLRKNGAQTLLVVPLMRWAMTAESTLYNLTRPILKAE